MEWWLAILGLGVLAWVLRIWWRGRRQEPSRPVPAAAPDAVRPPASYSASNVGNDASARPWEHQHGAFDAAQGRTEPASPAGMADACLPSGFDAAVFLEASKVHFIQLQAAWDRADILALRAMMTDAMLGQIQPQLLERERQAGAVGQGSEVVMLDAKLLGIEEQASGYLASVEFSGLIRDAAAAGPNPFREVWSIIRPRSGADGWLVAGVQAMQ
ncbi:MAG: hypothetical protein RLZZ22_1680 [Pseudomonadota bacterium]|jgi:predicted lipid-binding transport protein (Tim44 family)